MLKEHVLVPQTEVGGTEIAIVGTQDVVGKMQVVGLVGKPIGMHHLSGKGRAPFILQQRTMAQHTPKAEPVVLARDEGHHMLPDMVTKAEEVDGVSVAVSVQHLQRPRRQVLRLPISCGEMVVYRTAT